MSATEQTGSTVALNLATGGCGDAAQGPSRVSADENERATEALSRGATVALPSARVAKRLSSSTLQDDARTFIVDQHRLTAGVSVDGTRIAKLASALIRRCSNRGVLIVTSVHSLTLARVVLAMLLGLSSLVVQAADETAVDMSAVQLQPQEQNGITYLTGGIGKDESQAFQQIQGYNLHMTFSAGPTNDYLSGVDVMIQTAAGRSLLSLSGVGPIVYVKLPADKYVVIASQKGQEMRSTVVLEGTSVGVVNLHWNE